MKKLLLLVIALTSYNGFVQGMGTINLTLGTDFGNDIVKNNTFPRWNSCGLWAHKPMFHLASEEAQGDLKRHILTTLDSAPALDLTQGNMFGHPNAPKATLSLGERSILNNDLDAIEGYCTSQAKISNRITWLCALAGIAAVTAPVAYVIYNNGTPSVSFNDIKNIAWQKPALAGTLFGVAAGLNYGSITRHINGRKNEIQKIKGIVNEIPLDVLD